jgi:hypothetical protein
MWRLTSVVDLVIARVNRALEQLVHFLLAHLLTQVRQDVLDLALADEAAPVLIEDLEAADVFLDVEGFAEAAGAVEDLGEGFEVDCEKLSVSARLWVCGAGVFGLREMERGKSVYEKRTVGANTTLQVANLSKGRVLSTCAQEVAQCAAVDTAVAALVEELEGFAVVCGGRVAVIHCCSVLFSNRSFGVVGWLCAL